MNNLDFTRSAIIVVDPQNDYCVPGGITHALGYDVQGRDVVANNIETLLNGLRSEVSDVFLSVLKLQLGDGQRA